LAGLALKGCQVVHCPSTEGNLGDGIFGLSYYASQGGSWALGSDSHVGLCPFEELRWADYLQRLKSRQRLSMCLGAGDDAGARLFAAAWRGGLQAAGHPASHHGGVGQSFTGLVVDAEHLLLRGIPRERLLSVLIYAAGSRALKATIVRGRWLVREGAHQDWPAIEAKFRLAMERLRAKAVLHP